MKSLKLTKFTGFFPKSVQLLKFSHLNISSANSLLLNQFDLNLTDTSYSNYYENCVANFNNYLCTLPLVKKIQYQTKEKSSLKRNRNKTQLNRFLSFLFRKGSKIKYLNYLNSGINFLFFSFFFFDKNLTENHKGYSETVELIPSFTNFYSIDIILQHFINLLEPFFYLRIKRVEKKFRKHLKKKFLAHPAYVNPSKRTNLVLKSLSYYINLFPSFYFSERVGYSLFKTLIEHRESYLYKRKIYMYSKIFRKFQTKVF